MMVVTVYLLILVVLINGSIAVNGQDHRLYNGSPINLQIAFDEFRNIDESDIQINFTISDSTKSKNIGIYQKFFKPYSSPILFVSILPPHYDFPELAFPRDLHVQNVTILDFVITPISIGGVRILPYPTIFESPWQTITQSGPSILEIFGDNLKGSTNVRLKFDPPLQEFIDYRDISRYPLKSNKLKLLLSRSLHETVTSSNCNFLFLEAIDTGAGFIFFLQPPCIAVFTKLPISYPNNVIPNSLLEPMSIESEFEQERNNKIRRIIQGLCNLVKTTFNLVRNNIVKFFSIIKESLYYMHNKLFYYFSQQN